MNYDVTVDIREAVEKFKAAEKQAQWAAIVAINRTLTLAQREIIDEMTRVFSMPTSYTLGGTFIEQAKRGKLVGMVALKDERSSGKGTPATKYLAPSVYGGDRRMKRFERALQLAGVMPIGMYAIPGTGAKIDANGNMDRGQIVQILAYMQAFGEQGYRANTTDKGRAKLKRGTKRSVYGFTYFVLRSKRGKLPPGIYQSTKTGMGYSVRPILIFVDGAPNYERRFDFVRTADTTARARFGELYSQALRETLATAR